MDLELHPSIIAYNHRYMLLKIFVDTDDEELLNKYRETIAERNDKIKNNPRYIDAGFDLFSPETRLLSSSGVNKLDYKVICCAKMVLENGIEYTTGFYMYPRSSISKSDIRLANNTGIIDSGYRGHLIGMFDVVYSNETLVNKLDRHLQICGPGLAPIIVEMVNSREELGEETVRGTGGFGSTGI